MGFMKGPARAGMFGAAGLLASQKKKKDQMQRQPFNIASQTPGRRSLISEQTKF